ncbi:uncharacterized protein LOC117181623 isoform X2 [Belonocnema kinseyi]|uniref:uncharacterized protein LOC117181623 isoform X2 n=1 Tax=Belonocnema kinseyi TaxID=2817044 RepID=UPI00143D1E6F|nr:uncharacterized protein LOC117181623 isoform X2 [Belonocnema kinseyi]
MNTRQPHGLAENPLEENLDTTGLPIVFADFPNVRASEGCFVNHQESSHLQNMQGRLNWEILESVAKIEYNPGKHIEWISYVAQISISLE